MGPAAGGKVAVESHRGDAVAELADYPSLRTPASSCGQQTTGSAVTVGLMRRKYQLPTLFTTDANLSQMQSIFTIELLRLTSNLI